MKEREIQTEMETQGTASRAQQDGRVGCEKEIGTHRSQLVHRFLAYSILFEHDLRRINDVVHRLLEHAALQWMS